jgi:4-hydroxy-tetrahydrodipicolinate synthase
MEGIKRLVEAGIPTVVGTGAQNTSIAAAHAAHAREVGANGLMVIPRVLSRGSSPAAQVHHFSEILKAGGDLPAVIYNSLSYAAENITSQDESLILMAGVDTQVYHGFVNCGATGAITGVGNALPKEILRFIELCEAAAKGDPQARRYALELSEALTVLSTFDEGPDLVLYYKELMVLEGHTAYQQQLNSYDQLSPAQKQFLHDQHALFRNWWSNWEGK